jgi:hypothetical protein
MANRFTDPRPQFHDATPEVYGGGLLYFYETGTTTETDTYSDPTLTTPNTNPVVLDSAGRLPNDVFLDPNVTYKVVLTDADNVTIWTADPVDDPAANVTAAFQVYTGNPNGHLAGSAGTPGGSGASSCWDITNRLLYVCVTTGTNSTAVWEQVGATLAGGVQMTGIISPTALAADQNDYSPTGNAAASIVRQDASANVVISGLADGLAGFIKTIFNTSSAHTITLADQSSNTASAAANRFALGGSSVVLFPGQSIELIYDSVSSRWRQNGTHPMLPMPWPGGRLTLESGVPVSSTDQTAKTTIYYTPHIHAFVPLYTGANWYVAPFSELSQTLADTTKSPSAAAVSSVYDMFIWNDAGTLRLSRGPAWSSATSRGTGAGTTELERINGIFTNKVAITNGPSANLGLYVGTISTSASGANGQLNMMFLPTVAAGGTNNRLDVWNMYNRMTTYSSMRDSTDSWSYGTATWRSANNSTSNRISYVVGIAEEVQTLNYAVTAHCAGNLAHYAIGVGFDTTSSPGGSAVSFGAGILDTGRSPTHVNTCIITGVGAHYAQALETWVSGTNNITFYGDNATAHQGMQLLFTAMM